MNKKTGWILMILLLSVQWPVYFLEASNNDTGQALYRHTTSLGHEFEMHYGHSVAKTPVIEIYRIMPDKRILLMEMVYESYGAGLPTAVDQGYEMNAGTFRRYNIHMVTDSLIYRADPQNLGLEMKLVIESDAIPLYSFSEERTPVKIQVKRAPLWLFWLQNP